MSKTYRTTRRVEFRDTDAAGIAHFTAFFAYMEEIEHEFLRSLGLSVIEHDEQGAVSFPRVSAHCDYTGAVRFEDVMEVELAVGRLGQKSVAYHFVFSHEGRDVAAGQIMCVCCRLTAGERPKSMPIPRAFAAQLREYAEQLDV
jgi:4-hydroxybenzoyl-CoA thioesterase/acyl-CoA thioester hydrolase